MLERVTERLKSLGYTIKDNDNVIIQFCIEKVENYIKSDTNQSKIPDALIHVAVDMSVGEFLRAKKPFSAEEIANLDYAVTHLREGDVDITFGGTLSAEQRIDNFISYLLNNGKSEFSCFRRLRW